MDFYVTVAQVIPVLLLGALIETGGTRSARHSVSLRFMLGLSVAGAFAGELTALLISRSPNWSSPWSATVCELATALLVGVLCGGLVVGLVAD